MSAKPVELYAVLGEPPNGLLVAKVWVEKAGDLYITTHAPFPMEGKYSHHTSGVTHHYHELIKRRSGEGEAKQTQLRGMRGHELVSAWDSPAPIPPDGYSPRPDTKRRRTLVAPMPAMGWQFSVWAIQRGSRDIAERIAETNPWPTVETFATLLMDWSDPWLLLAFARWTAPKPYRLFRYEPSLPGRVPFERYPDAYEGTWLEHEGAGWYPGEPFPEEWLKQSREYVAQQEKASRLRRAR